MAELRGENENAEPRVYELGFLLLPTITEEEVAKEVEALKEQFQNAGASFVTEEFPKKIPLAYAIKKETEGKNTWFESAYFGWMKYELSPEAVPLLEQTFAEYGPLLRYLLVQTVRESTLAPKRSLYSKSETGTRIEPKTGLRKAEKPSAPTMTEEELDRTIEELVIE